jgi:hypothetical protein
VITPTIVVAYFLALGLAMAGAWLAWKHHKRVLANADRSADELIAKLKNTGPPLMSAAEWAEEDRQWREMEEKAFQQKGPCETWNPEGVGEGKCPW